MAHDIQTGCTSLWGHRMSRGRGVCRSEEVSCIIVSYATILAVNAGNIWMTYVCGNSMVPLSRLLKGCKGGVKVRGMCWCGDIRDVSGSVADDRLVARHKSSEIHWTPQQHLASLILSILESKEFFGVEGKGPVRLLYADGASHGFRITAKAHSTATWYFRTLPLSIQLSKVAVWFPHFFYFRLNDLREEDSALCCREHTSCPTYHIVATRGDLRILYIGAVTVAIANK